jgi:predicted NAD/FAD-binding protein
MESIAPLDKRNGDSPVTMTYHLNRLQALVVQENYCLTLNANGSIPPEKILRKLVYNHPLYTLDAVGRQHRWSHGMRSIWMERLRGIRS